MELDHTSNERSRFGALFPEIPVEAERQAFYMSLLVGALVFSAIMGWGPHGRWLSGLGTAKAATKSLVATPRNVREGNVIMASESSVLPTSPATTLPVAGIPGPETTEVPAVETAAEAAVPETSSQGTVSVAPTTVPVAEAPVASVTEAPVTEAPVTEAEVGTSTTVIDPLELSPTLPALDTAA